MSDEVCLAARMPASRAVCSGSPFLTAPVRIEPQRLARHRDRSARDRLAAGDRLVADVDHLHAPARVDVRQPLAPACPALPARPAFQCSLIAIALGEEERQAFERHRQVDALQLHVGRHLQRAGRKVQDRLDAGGDDEAEDVLRGRRRHGDHGDADAFAPRDLLQVVDVVDRHAAARLLADLLASACRRAPRSRSLPGGSPDSRRARGRGCRRP